MEGAEDVDRGQLVSAVLEAGRRVSQAAVVYHSKVAARFALGPTDMKALDLVQSAGPLTPSELASRMGFAPASVTAMIDRLEAKGLLRRANHPTDGRRRLVEFDPSALKVLAPVYAGFFTSLTEMLETYSDEELAVLARAFTDVADRQMTAADDLDTPATAPKQGDSPGHPSLGKH